MGDVERVIGVAVHDSVLDLETDEQYVCVAINFGSVSQLQADIAAGAWDNVKCDCGAPHAHCGHVRE